MTMHKKLLVCFSFVSLFSVFSASYVALHNATSILKTEQEKALNHLVDEKITHHINDYILKKEQAIAALANQPVVMNALDELSQAFKLGVSSHRYLTEDLKVRQSLQQYKEISNSYDLFLIDKDGNIVFSILHESDFTSNLKSGPYKESQLAQAYLQTLSSLNTRISLFEPYTPSQEGIKTKEDHSAFVTAPVFKEGKLIGVVATQIQGKDYYSLALDYSGLKETGEVIFSKKVDDHAVVIAPLRGNPKAAFNLRYLIGSDSFLPIQYAVTGEKGSGLARGIDDKEVLAVWRYIPELEWGVVLTIDADEAFLAVTKLEEQLLLTGFFVLMISTLVAFSLSRRITKPVLHLMKVVDGRLQGFKKERPVKLSGDEIGQLSFLFNEMFTALDDSESELELSNQSLQQTVSELEEQKFALNQHSIVAITDVQGRIIFTNDKFTAISGYSRDELLGQDHRLLNSGYHDKEFFKEMYLSIANGKIWHAEVCNRNKQGQLYWVDTTVVPLMGDNKKPQRYIAIRTDISEQKITEHKLLEAKNASEQAVVAKSEFLASMSHEIRTPMNGVLGMLGLVLGSNLDEEQKQRLSVAQSSAQSLLYLINDILDLSKVEAGKLDLENVDFDLCSMLAEFTSAMAFQAHEKKLELILDIKGVELTEVKGDLGRLRQILTNLVSNAIKFTASGEVLIQVTLSSVNEQKLELKCSVIDSGIGIPANKQLHLFDSFSQVDTSTTRKYGGTGLGLAIAKKITRLMGGELLVSSEEGKGSTFTATVFLEKSSQAKKITAPEGVDKLSVLIVDDNAIVGNVIKERLECWGVSVKLATSGQEALLICERRFKESEEALFDFVFVDLHMPEMDGIELAGQLNNKGQRNEMKLILMTLSLDQVNAKFLAEKGFSGYFSKPASNNDLFNALSISHKGGLPHIELSSDRSMNSMEQNNESNEMKTSNAQSWQSAKHILLVEDNAVNQMVAKGMLKVCGFQVSQIDVAGNGLEALDKLRQATDNAYDIILMDCQMPQMDGYEAAGEIRKGEAGERNKLIPIVAMTANAMQGDKELCLQAGMSDYLTKPIDHKTLAEKLEYYLSSSNAQKEQEVQSKGDVPIERLSTHSDPVSMALAVWDKKDALQRVMDDEDFMLVLIDVFLADIPNLVSELEQAISENNDKEVGLVAHAIKGSAANLSCMQLQYLAYQIELAGKEADTNKASALLPSLLECYKQLRTCFESYTASHVLSNDQKENNSGNEQVELLSAVELADTLVDLRVKLRKNLFIDQQELLILNKVSIDPIATGLVEQLKREISQFSNEAALDTLGQLAVKTSCSLYHES